MKTGIAARRSGPHESVSLLHPQARLQQGRGFLRPAAQPVSLQAVKKPSDESSADAWFDKSNHAPIANGASYADSTLAPPISRDVRSDED